jgi:hypothetical protein
LIPIPEALKNSTEKDVMSSYTAQNIAHDFQKKIVNQETGFFLFIYFFFFILLE